MNNRVLIATGDEQLRKLLAIWLKGNGYFVNTVDSSKAVEAHCGTQNYGVLILFNHIDGGMNGGMRLIPKIREIKPNIKIILITGGQDLTLEDVQKVGGNAVLRAGSIKAHDVLETIALLTGQGE